MFTKLFTALFTMLKIINVIILIIQQNYFQTSLNIKIFQSNYDFFALVNLQQRLQRELLQKYTKSAVNISLSRFDVFL